MGRGAGVTILGVAACMILLIVVLKTASYREVVYNDSCCNECMEAFSHSPVDRGAESIECSYFKAGGTLQEFFLSERCAEHFKNSPASVATCMKYKEEKAVSIEMVGVEETSILETAKPYRINEVVTVGGVYEKYTGYGGRILVDTLENNKVERVYLFLPTKLNASNGALVAVTGRITAYELGYAYMFEPTYWKAIEMNLTEGEKKSEEAIKYNAERLGAFNLTEISLQGYKNATARYGISKIDFMNPEVSFSFADFKNGKTVYVYNGPRLPPFGAIVYRYVYVFCVYDVNTTKVEKIIVTISGHAEE